MQTGAHIVTQGHNVQYFEFGKPLFFKWCVSAN